MAASRLSSDTTARAGKAISEEHGGVRLRHALLQPCYDLVQKSQHLSLDYDLRLRTSGWRRYDSQRGQVHLRVVPSSWPASCLRTLTRVCSSVFFILLLFNLLQLTVTESEADAAGEAAPAG